jgi:isopentenyl-diphosphate delta-isomerase type 1
MPIDNAAEQFYLVDKNDQVLGSISRKEAHADKTKIHRAVTILLFNAQHELLLQQRSVTKDTSPGAWDVSTCGHVTFGQTYQEAALREMAEEIGVSAPVNFVGKVLVELPSETEFVCLYETHLDNPKIAIDTEEVAQTMWLPMNQLAEFIHAHDFSPISRIVLKKLKYLPED